MKKKIVIGIVVFFMLVLLVPIRLQMKDGGSVQYKAVLYSVTKYHQITMEWDDENEEVADSGYRVGWGVKVLGLEIFNNVKYVSDADSVRGEQTDFLKNISEDYTLEDARIDGCVCFDNGDITEGQKIWDDFVDATNTQEEATVRLAFYYSLDEEQCDPEYYESVKDEYPVLYIQELTYKDNSYTIRWFEEGEEIKKTYKYLMKYEGEPESETALYKSYLRYVLTNDNTVTWEQIWKGLISSQLGDGIDYKVVYQKYNYNHNMQEYCNAKVLEIYEDCFLSECLDVTSGLLKTGAKVMVPKKVVATAGVPELNTGDHVRIVYNGLKRTKTEEMKIVYAIYHLDENEETGEWIRPIEITTHQDQEWGITLTAENVTPTSATIKCTQSGGEPTGELQTGSRYILETYTQDHGWQAVPCYAEIFWTEEAWVISKDRVTEWKVKWERFYGKLSKGKYRIGKEIMDVRDTGDYDKAIYYAEFEIVE